MKKKLRDIDKREAELQQKIESGQSPGTAEEQAYWLVFRALQKEIEIPLPASFAERVAFLATNEKKTQKRSSVLDYLLFAIGFVLLIVAVIVSIVLTDFKFNFGFLTGLSNYFGVILMGVALIILFQIIDMRVIRREARPGV